MKEDIIFEPFKLGKCNFPRQRRAAGTKALFLKSAALGNDYGATTRKRVRSGTQALEGLTGPIHVFYRQAPAHFVTLHTNRVSKIGVLVLCAGNMCYLYLNARVHA